MSDGWPTNGHFLKNWPQVHIDSDRHFHARLHLGKVKFNVCHINVACYCQKSTIFRISADLEPSTLAAMLTV